MVSIEFHFRSSVRSGMPGSVFVRVIAHRKCASLTLPYKVYPAEWDSGRQRLLWEVAGKERAGFLRDVNERLEQDRLLLEEIKSEVDDPGPGEAARIISVFKMRRVKSGLCKVVETLSDELKHKGQERTARAYRSMLSRLLQYGQIADIALGDITHAFVLGFERFLKEKGCSPNTISFYMRNLRAVYNKSVARGRLVSGRKDLFKEVYTGVAPSQKRALTPHQLRRLENLLSDPEMLNTDEQEALSLFLFSFHGRGISFVDLAHLKKEDLKKGVLFYKRHKTGIPLQAKVNEVMKKILGGFIERTEHSPYLFPLINPSAHSSYLSYSGALRLQNMRLQRIARKLGISGGLTTHMARHSWATIAKRENIPIAVISESLGHRSVSTTHIYLDNFEKEVIDRAAAKVSRVITGHTTG